jgi:ribosomal protein S18 acetylase RimI-like enzyme
MVRRARLDDIDETSEVLAAAFSDYPWTRWTVDDEEHLSRIRSLQHLAMAELALPYGQVWISLHCGRIVSAAVWMDPNPPIPPEVLASVAAQSAALEGGRHNQAMVAESVLASLRPSEPHYYLGAVGTRPEHQREGRGRAVLQPVIASADEHRVDLYLETSSPSNVNFYSRLGFRISGEVDVPNGGPHVWAMLRTTP